MDVVVIQRQIVTAQGPGLAPGSALAQGPGLGLEEGVKTARVFGYPLVLQCESIHIHIHTSTIPSLPTLSILIIPNILTHSEPLILSPPFPVTLYPSRPPPLTLSSLFFLLLLLPPPLLPCLRRVLSVLRAHVSSRGRAIHAIHQP